MIDSIKQLLQQEAQAVLNIPVTNAYEKAVKLIVEQIHQKKGKLVTSGMGKAGQIAMNIATTFCSTGIPSVFLHPSEAQHGDLGILQRNDLLLLISNSGKTREIVELTQLAHNLDPELKFIVITGNADSAAAAYLAGTLVFDPNARCTHHDHEESHSCGAHACHADKGGCTGSCH